MKKSILFFVFVATLSLVACRNNGENGGAVTSGSDIEAIDAQGGEKFAEFYDKFLGDSLFQVSRIIFPLEGRAKFVDSLNHKDEFYYMADSWSMHRKIDLSDKKYNRKFTDFGIGVVKEIIEMKEGKDVLFIERRYRLDNKKWFLMFYGNLNVRNPEAME
jgi:hypothetical protein